MDEPPRWERVTGDCYAADLGGLGRLEVYTDPVAGPWMAEAFGRKRENCATARDAQVAAVRMARERIEAALRRLDGLEPPV
jgi:hypothetical protein